MLGWSGVWAWDPVENASLLPWLTGTAYIHSVLVQERRGMLRVWNLSLLVATFSLTILGTFLTRIGRDQLACTRSATGRSDRGCSAFFGVVVVVSLGLIAWRGDRLRSPGAIDSPISREGAFLANNVVFTVFAFVVLLGTVFPLIVEALAGPPDRRRCAVLRSAVDADRPRAAVPDGASRRCCRGARRRGELLRERLFWPAWCGAGAMALAVVVGADGWAPLVAFGLGGFAAGSALRQLVAGHPPPGLARPRRPGQRRHGRAHRRDPHRRRARGVEQLHPLGDARARRRASRSSGAGTRSNSSSVDERTNDARASACWRPTSSSTAARRTARRPRPT